VILALGEFATIFKNTQKGSSEKPE